MIMEETSKIVQEECTQKGLASLLHNEKRVLIAPEEGDQFLAPIVRATTYGATDRSAYNKLLDGKACKTLCAGRGSKISSVSAETPKSSVGIVAFHWVEPFLKDQAMDLLAKNDGFLGRLFIICPRPRGDEEKKVQSNSKKLKNGYAPGLQSFAGIYNIVDIQHQEKDITYTFDKHAQKERIKNADQEMEASNENWRKMEDGEDTGVIDSYIIQEFKVNRLLPRLAALLHILQYAYHLISDGLVDINGTKEDIEGQIMVAGWPTVITLETYHRAERIMAYLSDIRDTLLTPIMQKMNEPTTKQKPKQNDHASMREKIMNINGIFLTPRISAKAFSSGMQVTNATVVPVLKQMEVEGFGKYFEEGRLQGFLKTFPLGDENLQLINMTAAAYKTKCKQTLPASRLSKAIKAWLLTKGGADIAGRLEDEDDMEEENNDVEQQGNNDLKEAEKNVEVAEEDRPSTSGLSTHPRKKKHTNPSPYEKCESSRTTSRNRRKNGKEK